MADLLVAFRQQAQHMKLGAKAEIFIRLRSGLVLLVRVN
jgi:hypothetical protein